MTRRGDMGQEGVQLLVGVEDTVLSEIIGRQDRAYTLAPCLLVERLGAAIWRQRSVVRSVRGHCHLQYRSSPVWHSVRAALRDQTGKTLAPGTAPRAGTYGLGDPTDTSPRLSCAVASHSCQPNMAVTGVIIRLLDVFNRDVRLPAAGARHGRPPAAQASPSTPRSAWAG